MYKLQTTLDVIIITGVILGFFISLSLITTSFYNSRANKYLSISLFLLVWITFLGWYDADHGILEFLHGIMWEFLVPVTLFTYFLIQIKHSYLQKNWYKWLYAIFVITFLIDIYLDLDFVFGIYNSPFDEDTFIVDLFFFIEDSLSFWYNVVLMIWARRLVQKAEVISREKRHWLLRLNLFIILILVIWFVSNLEEIFLDSEYVLQLLWAILSFLSWWLLYYGVFKLQIVIQKDEIHRQLTIHPIEHLSKKRNTDTVSKLYCRIIQNNGRRKTI